MKKSFVTMLALVVSTLFAVESFARDQINIVGSSTVYPYGTCLLYTSDAADE